VQGIIRGHKGGLGVSSHEGSGTTFRILLPAGALELAALDAPAPREGKAEPRVVLVIDDEDYMLEVVRDSLAASGHGALLAGSGEAGLQLLRLRGEAIDLILLDLSMPGLSGVETFKRLSEFNPTVPVVVTSGFAEEDAVAQLEGLDPAGFLQKPYRSRTLVDLVEALAAK